MRGVDRHFSMLPVVAPSYIVPNKPPRGLCLDSGNWARLLSIPALSAPSSHLSRWLLSAPSLA